MPNDLRRESWKYTPTDWGKFLGMKYMGKMENMGELEGEEFYESEDHRTVLSRLVYLRVADGVDDAPCGEDVNIFKKFSAESYDKLKDGGVFDAVSKRMPYYVFLNVSTQNFKDVQDDYGRLKDRTISSYYHYWRKLRSKALEESVLVHVTKPEYFTDVIVHAFTFVRSANIRRKIGIKNTVIPELEKLDLALMQ